MIKPLGQGGFGKTYLAEDTDKLNKPCVIKQLFYQGQSSNANQKVVELFMREAKQLDQLKANQQIPDLLAYFEEGDFLFLAQEYVEGEDLLYELRRDGPFKEEKIKELFLDLLPVLEFIHSKGLIHRDLKPDNIMRRKQDGRLILIDFGVARQISMSQLTVTGTKVGSPGYFAMEQFAEGKATASSDLYSIGATAFHLLTGQYPGDLWTMEGYSWVNNWQEHLSNPITPNLHAIISKLLQIKVEDRYQAANAVLSDLNQPDIQATTENLRRYEEEFEKAVQSAYPLDDYVWNGLKQFQQSLELTDADVMRIEQPILKQAETQAENLRWYEEEFKKAVQSTYPLDDYVRDGLKQFQQSLGLTDADVERIEQPILKQAEAERQEKFRRQQVEAKRRAEEQRRQKTEASKQAQKKTQATSTQNPEPQDGSLLPEWSSCQWIYTNLIGLNFGFFVSYSIGDSIEGGDLDNLLGYSIASTGLGVVMGLFQWLVLRKYISYARGWILLSAAGFGVGSFIANIVLILEPNGVFGFERVIALTAMGFIIGLFQWLKLRKHSSRTRKWIFVNTASLGLVPLLACCIWGKTWWNGERFYQILLINFFVYVATSAIVLKELLINTKN